MNMTKLERIKEFNSNLMALLLVECSDNEQLALGYLLTKVFEIVSPETYDKNFREANESHLPDISGARVLASKLKEVL